MSDFEELNLSKPLLSGILNKGYTLPTPIQRKAFPLIMSGKDVLGIAQTGTGKTLAYLLPCLRRWKFSKTRFPQILILVPTRELTIQVKEEIDGLCELMNVVTVAAYGGTGMLTQMNAVEEGCDVVVATPGRLFDLVMKGSLKLKEIKYFVVDEVDEMLDLGFKHQIINILDLLPSKRQNLFFSATLNEEVEELIEQYIGRPEKLEVAPSGTPLESIEQISYAVPNFMTKVNLLIHLLETREEMKKVLVFVSTKKLADKLYDLLRHQYPIDSAVIHSNKSQNFRFLKIREFEEGKFPLLISTDLVSRGIDILDISHVINFDLPSTAESYLHRMGRTGRAEKHGKAISFFSPYELDKKQSIETLMRWEIPIAPLPEDVELSLVQLPEEAPQVKMKNFLVKPFDVKSRGEALHEKSAKNKKKPLTRPELNALRNKRKKKK
jgi:ATP-dependent RNA helicase RhlE